MREKRQLADLVLGAKTYQHTGIDGKSYYYGIHILNLL